ncbi:OmpA family protein [Sedimentitalea nanhaiensis]|uniref:Outer membrane protein OmpA n=1 Tax=Sedimentitalea nanhaiensis TaxID=999627 RepID=A0A1I6Z0U1_9RHOB|nr:OmpA family protein [Sedimentitalea nanhaiensis]SFT56294.1 Outer membrane protein OmpA [Sedimentitalea nanhaiensis]
MTLNHPLIAAVAAIALLGACNDPSRLGGPPDPNAKAKQGALIGAAGGAALSALTGGEGANLVLGAAAGAAAGGLIGNRLDKQATELRSQLANDGITVTNAGDRLIVSLPQDITFDTDSAAVRSSLRSELVKVANNLNNYPASRVQVVGHTDNTGDATYNLGLSLRRANAVADILQADGVRFDRISTSGRGEEQPLASNLTPEGRAQNRRVEIVVIPQNG